jgi:glycosyltransferase involved in cell wall biosynthesis
LSSPSSRSGGNPSEPLVSIGLPVYNGGAYLAGSIESLLGQTYRNIELYISDNASTDGSSALCAEFARRDSRVRYSRLETNIGGVNNHNRVIEETRGDYFMFGSSDDLWQPTYVQRCVEVLNADPGVVLAYTINATMDENGSSTGAYPAALRLDVNDVVQRFSQLTPIANPIEPFYGLIRRGALRTTARMPLHPGFDRFLLAELGLLGRFHQILEPLYIRRLHQNQSTKAYRSLRARYRWVNAGGRERRFVWPHVDFARLYAAAVLRSAPDLKAKAGCFVHLLKWCNWHRRDLWDDLRGAE